MHLLMNHNGLISERLSVRPHPSSYHNLHTVSLLFEVINITWLVTSHRAKYLEFNVFGDAGFLKLMLNLMIWIIIRLNYHVKTNLHMWTILFVKINRTQNIKWTIQIDKWNTEIFEAWWLTDDFVMFLLLHYIIFVIVKNPQLLYS